VPTEHPWLKSLAGRFIVLEGPDGSGKTTQFRRLLGAAHEASLTVREVREPGGTAVGERIRALLLDPIHHDMSLACEMLLYMASRAQLCEQTIRPALARGELVLADRFVSSTIAYQGHAGGMPLEDIQDAARIATGGLRPDLVVVFDVDERTAAGRLNPLLDRMEAKGAAFHRKVREGYLAQVRDEPARHLLIDASRPAEQVWYSLLGGLRRWAEHAEGAAAKG
jgi:dTMP kinase